MLNFTCIQGRLGQDPELRYTQTNLPVVSFSIACSRNTKDKQSGQYPVDWIRCIAWRSTAEFVSKYFRKGQMAIVTGRLQTNAYTDKQGNNRSTLELIADNVYFGSSKEDSGYQGNNENAQYANGNNNGYGNGQYRPANNPVNISPGNNEPYTDYSDYDKLESPENDLPF